MSIIEFFSQPVWHRISLTLIHFIWQGLIIAILVSVCVRILKVHQGNNRYTVYLLAFLAMMLCPVVTFIAIDVPKETISPVSPQGTGLTKPVYIASDTNSSCFDLFMMQVLSNVFSIFSLLELISALLYSFLHLYRSRWYLDDILKLLILLAIVQWGNHIPQTCIALC